MALRQPQLSGEREDVANESLIKPASAGFIEEDSMEKSCFFGILWILEGGAVLYGTYKIILFFNDLRNEVFCLKERLYELEEHLQLFEEENPKYLGLRRVGKIGIVIGEDPDKKMLSHPALCNYIGDMKPLYQDETGYFVFHSKEKVYLHEETLEDIKPYPTYQSPSSEMSSADKWKNSLVRNNQSE